jgi:hypothetical protein
MFSFWKYTKIYRTWKHLSEVTFYKMGKLWPLIEWANLNVLGWKFHGWLFYMRATSMPKFKEIEGPLPSGWLFLIRNPQLNSIFMSSENVRKVGRLSLMWSKIFIHVKRGDDGTPPLSLPKLRVWCAYLTCYSRPPLWIYYIARFIHGQERRA